MEYVVDIYKLREKTPKDGQKVAVKVNAKYSEWVFLVYNAVNNCWDDESGDDYLCELNEEDLWFDPPLKV